jgi:5-methylcytosine-specific restriction enzyme subunit McrC
MVGLTIYEFDALVTGPAQGPIAANVHTVPPKVFDWLEQQALRSADAGQGVWLRLTQRRAQRAVQVTSFVGVLRTPDGFQIEVLPKVGKVLGGGDKEARELLIEMLCCLGQFRHVQTDNATLLARRMPLLEVFIRDFLRSVESIVKRGIRSAYSLRQDNLFALRGKLQMASHLKQNLCRRDRFFTEFDEFSTDRPENRLLHAALRRVLSWTVSQEHQQLARELCFVFADVRASTQPAFDFRSVSLERGMVHYADALAWAKLILEQQSPLSGSGHNAAPSLLFPMAAVFEAFVAKHLQRQLAPSLTLRTQAQRFSLVRHRAQDWFRLKPDLLVARSGTNRLVLDTKWKLLDSKKANGTEKYGLDQSDFYQLHAYGHSYLDGEGDVVLIYPKTDNLTQALPVFDFPKAKSLRLWVIPFCLRTRLLILPACGSLDALFLLQPAPSPQTAVLCSGSQ